MDVRHTESNVNEHALIVGRYPLQSYLRFVRGKCVGGTSLHERVLAQEWREFQERATDANRAEWGIAENPTFDPIPDEMISIAQEARRHEATLRSFGSRTLQWWLVEIDRVVVFQPWIDLSYVREFQAGLTRPLSHEDHIRVAAGRYWVKPKVGAVQVSDDRYVFTSRSTDVRFLGAALLDPSAVEYQQIGYPTHVVAFFIGSGVNCLSAIHVNNRLILLNGTHRAYALRDLGFTHVACLVAHLENEEDKAQMLPAAVRQDEARFLTSRRPPVFKDYFDPAARKVLPTMPTNLVLTMKVEQSKEAIPMS